MTRDLEANYGADKKDVIQKFIENPDFMLVFNVVSLAKNHNFFGKLDDYMKEFARILINLPDQRLS